MILMYEGVLMKCLNVTIIVTAMLNLRSLRIPIRAGRRWSLKRGI